MFQQHYLEACLHGIRRLETGQSTNATQVGVRAPANEVPDRAAISYCFGVLLCAGGLSFGVALVADVLNLLVLPIRCG